MKKWCFIVLFFVSCSSSKVAPNFSMLERTITFDKTKISINSKSFGSITLKGYISLIKDSLLCFKFYGPLAYDVLSGVYSDTFKVMDNFNKIKYSTFDTHIFQLSGIVINRNVLEFLMLGKVLEVKREILKLNSNNIQIELNNGPYKRLLMISNTVDHKLYQIQCNLKNQIPASVVIYYKDDLTSWSAEIQNIYITNLTKKCNFGF